MKTVMQSVYRRIKSVLFLIFISATNLHCQLATDTSAPMVLSEQDFLNIVRAYHPVVKQAGYVVQRAREAVTQAKGDFDPIISTSFNRKQFGGTLYYSYYNPQLIIPTWYGIEIYAGAEEISGSRVNSESTLGQSSYLGISVPLLKDLVLDKRRAALQQAKAYNRQAISEQNLQLNNVLFEGVNFYWNWVRDYEVLQIINDIVRVNETRFRFLRVEVQQGSRPAIDTSEALAQLQNFQLLQNEALFRFRNATLELSNFLWLENETPYVLPERVTPDSSWVSKIKSLPVPALDSILATARLQHPKLQVYNYKIDWLKIDQKIKFQSMLPKLDIKANLLNEGYNVFSNVDAAFLKNNYKLGVNFIMPLRLSEGRGAYRQAKLKIAETSLGQKQELWQIENKVKSYYNDVLAMQQQVIISERMLMNYKKLLRGEETKIGIGESTLFILNTRENKVLESLQKVTELKTKFYKNYSGLQWAAGQMR